MSIDIPRDTDKGFPLCRIYEYDYTIQDVILSDENKEILEYIIQENKSTDKLNTWGFTPKNRLLFCGPPGTGKTLTAKVISSVLGYKMIYVSFDSTISSYLGETATNLRKIFDFIERGRYVVLFDEFDIVGKQRDDPHEHGEIKRVVNNFMQMIDLVNTNSVIIAATNHQHLLDKAIWRRFDDILYFDLPNDKQRRMLFKKHLDGINVNIDKFIDITKGFSGSDIDQICKSAIKKKFMEGKNDDSLNEQYIEWSISEQERRKRYQL